MLKSFIILSLMATLPWTAQATESRIGIGPSVPDIAGLARVGTAGVDRPTGGERILIKFTVPQTISNFKITAYSSSRQGSVLLHGMTASLQANGTTRSVPLDPVKGKLADGQSVEIKPQQLISALELQAEGYSHNDASLLLEMTAVEVGTLDGTVERIHHSPPPPRRVPNGCENGEYGGICRGCINAPCLPGPGDEGGIACNYPVPDSMRCH